MRRLLAAAALAALLARPATAFWGPIADPLSDAKKLFEAGEFPRVIGQLSPEFLQRLKRDALARGYLYLGVSYERTGRLGEALSTFQLAVKLFPADINLLSEQATLLHLSGLDEQAQPLFEKVLKIHPNNVRAHIGLAEIDRSLGLLEFSADHYDRALLLVPDRPELWRDYAEVLLDSRDAKAAELAIRKALSLSRDASSLVELGFIARADGRLDEAIAALDEALAQKPDDDVALTRALWCLEAGRLSEAEDAANARIEADPGDPLAHWIRARVELAQDRYNEAVADLRAASAGARNARFVADAAKALLETLEAPR